MKLPDQDKVKCFCSGCIELLQSPTSNVKHVRLRFCPPPPGEIHVFCDGSVNENKYGSGVVLVDTQQVQIHDQRLKFARKQHSLYAELLAVTFALKTIDNYLGRSAETINSVHVFTDVISISTLIGEHSRKPKDVYLAREVEEIRLLLQSLHITYSNTLVSIEYLEMKRNQFHRLAHRLSRSYKVFPRPVFEVELIPIELPTKKRTYTPEFKAQVVQEARGEGQIDATARKFNIAISTLYRWRQQISD